MSRIEGRLVQASQTPRALLWLGSTAFCVLLFLANIDFGAPPSNSLDASWTQVIGWAVMHALQWGRDIVYTYGPLGFLHGRASYVPGILPYFVTGQILLNVAFALLATVYLQRTGRMGYVLFTIAYVCAYPYVPADVSWTMTILFATVLLLRLPPDCSSGIFLSCVAALALLAAAIALIKFSMFLVWLLCGASLFVHTVVRRGVRQATLALAILVSAIALFWVASGQNLQNFPAYIQTSFVIAGGYAHAMGAATSMGVQVAGLLCLFAFAGMLLLAAHAHRRSFESLLTLALFAAVSFLVWRTGFTRADHAPWFFCNLAMLAIALMPLAASVPAQEPLRLGWKQQFRRLWCLRNGFALLTLACSAAGLLGPSNGLMQRFSELASGLEGHWHNLRHWPDLQAQKQDQLSAARSSVRLPGIRRVVGDASVDLFTQTQGDVLLNELNYAPRPVFQSFAAYTPNLEQINEKYILGAHAPTFVMLKLDSIDGRLPMGDDALALAGLLERYRPTLLESDYLLLQKMPSAVPATISPPATTITASLGQDIAVPLQEDALTIAFVKLELSWLGKLYAFLLREPELRIGTATDSWGFDDRLVRPTAAAGFVLSPMIRSTQDWMRLQSGATVRRVRTVRIQPAIEWQSIFFKRQYRVGFSMRSFQHFSTTNAPANLIGSVYPGFNVMPSAVQGVNDIIDENGKPALFLHAPGTLRFVLQPGRYRVSGEVGIREAAMTTPACTSADGIGLSIDRIRDGAADTPLMHLELDPFHKPADKGAHGFSVDSVALEAGEQLEVRLDPGHGGSNTACDWSYVRDLRFDGLTRAD